MNVIDINTRRPVGQNVAPFAEVEILDGFAEFKRADDIVCAEFRANHPLAETIAREIETMRDATIATWEARSNVVDFKTRRALELQVTMPEPEITRNGQTTLIECFLRRDQAECLAREFALSAHTVGMVG